MRRAPSFATAISAAQLLYDEADAPADHATNDRQSPVPKICGSSAMKAMPPSLNTRKPLMIKIHVRKVASAAELLRGRLVDRVMAWYPFSTADAQSLFERQLASSAIGVQGRMTTGMPM